MAVATPASPLHAPTAAARSSTMKLASMIARLPGVSRAPPTPWRARALMSTAPFGASAQSSEAQPNHTVPMTNTLRLPSRSPSEPPSSNSDASVSV